MNSETEPVVVNQEPKIPEELWMLWVTYNDGSGNWLMAVDEYCLICCENEQQAKWAADHQESLYGIKTKPVRVT